MTAAEKRHLRRLEIRVTELETALQRTTHIYSGNLYELVNSRIAMKQALAAIEEAACVIHEIIKNDPQYMAENANRSITYQEES